MSKVYNVTIKINGKTRKFIVSDENVNTRMEAVNLTLQKLDIKDDADFFVRVKLLSEGFTEVEDDSAVEEPEKQTQTVTAPAIPMGPRPTQEPMIVPPFQAPMMAPPPVPMPSFGGASYMFLNQPPVAEGLWNGPNSLPAVTGLDSQTAKGILLGRMDFLMRLDHIDANTKLNSYLHKTVADLFDKLDGFMLFENWHTEHANGNLFIDVNIKGDKVPPEGVMQMVFHIKTDGRFVSMNLTATTKGRPLNGDGYRLDIDTVNGTYREKTFDGFENDDVINTDLANWIKKLMAVVDCGESYKKITG